MACSKCAIELASDDLKYRVACDRCDAKFCQSCSGLSSTEIRCMPLRERRLKFFCDVCVGEDNKHATLVEQILNCLKPIIDIGLMGIKETTETRINSLSQQVADLAESNKDLIRLLNPTPAVVNASQRRRQHQHNIEHNTSRHDSPPYQKANESMGAPISQETSMPCRAAGNGSRRPKVDVTAEFRATAVKDHRGDCVRGTAPTPEVAAGSVQDTFAAVARRAYLYIGKVNPGASKDTIVKYIRNKAPGVDFVVDELPKREEALSRAFKLTMDFTLLETFNRSDFWPQGVIVKRFFQFKSRRQ